MTLLPVADGARLLGIHPKTLHLWLKQAHVPVVAHPTDARIGCVEWERIQQVANLHGRSLPSPATTRPVASAGLTPLLPLLRSCLPSPLQKPSCSRSFPAWKLVWPTFPTNWLTSHCSSTRSGTTRWNVGSVLWKPSWLNWWTHRSSPHLFPIRSLLSTRASIPKHSPAFDRSFPPKNVLGPACPH